MKDEKKKLSSSRQGKARKKGCKMYQDKQDKLAVQLSWHLRVAHVQWNQCTARLT